MAKAHARYHKVVFREFLNNKPFAMERRENLHNWKLNFGPCDKGNGIKRDKKKVKSIWK
jgi:hypothetical protein